MTFHDLRGTAVGRLVIVGCEVPAITTVTGNKLSEVAAIRASDHLSRDPALGAWAIRTLAKWA